METPKSPNIPLYSLGKREMRLLNQLPISLSLRKKEFLKVSLCLKYALPKRESRERVEHLRYDPSRICYQLATLINVRNIRSF